MAEPKVALVTGSGKKRVGSHVADLLAGRGHAVADQHVGDQTRGGNPDVDLAVLPARKRVALQMEVHAA